MTAQAIEAPSIPVAIRAIDDALKLLPPKLTSQEARVMLLAIALQESGCATRCQANNGPAHSMWQGEVTGGMCYWIFRHPATKTLAPALCAACRCSPLAHDVWTRIESDDVLAAGLARLLLLSDPKLLPAIGDESAAWDYYQRNWKPGKPHPGRWSGNYRAALAALEA